MIHARESDVDKLQAVGGSNDLFRHRHIRKNDCFRILHLADQRLGIGCAVIVGKCVSLLLKRQLSERKLFFADGKRFQNSNVHISVSVSLIP